jgi:chorismate mutase
LEGAEVSKSEEGLVMPPLESNGWDGTVPSRSSNRQYRNGFGAIIDLALDRLRIAEPIAALKFRRGEGIDDAAREEAVIKTVQRHASEASVDEQFVGDVFRDQIAATAAIEHYRFAQWRLNPADVPVPSADLSACRDRIDHLNGAMVAAIAANWASLGSHTCHACLDDARRAVIEARQLDQLYRLALAHATRRYCSATART